MIYSLISNIMLTYGKNNMMHRPIDKIIYDTKVIKKKYFFPCDIMETITIENVDLVLNHYNFKKKEIILYFPGGSFIEPPTILHYKYAKKIAKKLNKHVIMIQYPLFPECNPIESSILIRKLIDKKRWNKFILIGDSAGACLCLYILNGLNKANKDIVKKTILISPWFDATLKNEDILLIEQYDFILNKDNCQTLAKDFFSKYINGRMYLCPSMNDFRFQSDVLVLSGEYEIFTPDAIIWTKKQNILRVKHFVYKKMCHCFAILPIKEAKNALKNISIFLDK